MREQYKSPKLIFPSNASSKNVTLILDNNQNKTRRAKKPFSKAISNISKPYNL